jgi:hypothetical protein
MPPERNNSVVDAASPAHQRFVLPLFPPRELLFHSDPVVRVTLYFALFPVPGCCASGEQRSHQDWLAASLLVTEF